jgi:hypothetical protein
MTPEGLWECIAAAGITLTAEGENIRAEPRSALTDAIRNGIRANRRAVLARLALAGSTRSDGDSAHLLALVDRVAAHYGMPADELAEMKRLALADPSVAWDTLTADLATLEPIQRGARTTIAPAARRLNLTGEKS